MMHAQNETVFSDTKPVRLLTLHQAWKIHAVSAWAFQSGTQDYHRETVSILGRYVFASPLAVYVHFSDFQPKASVRKGRLIRNAERGLW